jgi:hypothetical protein
MTAYSKGQQQQQPPHSRQPRNNTGSSSSGAAAGGMLSDRDAAATAAAEARYADLYERELDPFRAFAQSEAEVSVQCQYCDHHSANTAVSCMCQQGWLGSRLDTGHDYCTARYDGVAALRVEASEHIRLASSIVLLSPSFTPLCAVQHAKNHV